MINGRYFPDNENDTRTVSELRPNVPRTNVPQGQTANSERSDRIEAAKFRTGFVIEWKKESWIVLNCKEERSFFSPVVHVTLQNAVTGDVVKRDFSPGDSFRVIESDDVEPLRWGEYLPTVPESTNVECSANNIEKCDIIIWNTGMWIVEEVVRVSPPQQPAFVRLRLRDAITNVIKEQAFSADASFEKMQDDVDVEEMVYVGTRDGKTYEFQERESKKKVTIGHEQLGDALKFVRPGDVATVYLFKRCPYAVKAPTFVDLKVVCTEAFSAWDKPEKTKPATLETGYIIWVPSFVGEGDVIKIDTRDGQFLCRA